MKTIKIIIMVFVAVLTASCSTYYRVVTTLDQHGSAVREVYAWGDSAFMAGNPDHNPYLFDISSGWDIVRYDSAIKYDYFGDKKKYNVKITGKASSIDLFSREVSCKENVRSFVSPEETLTKKSGLFYTTYTLTAVYKKLSYDSPVPINNYLTKEEQKLWTRGDFSSYGGMNGAEMADMLNGIESKFMDWYSRNCFEISLNGIKNRVDQNFSETDKDRIYKQLVEKEEREADIVPEKVCNVLDAFYKTDRFSKMYKMNKESIDRDFEDAMSIVNVLGNTISYELVLPGEITTANVPIESSDSIRWKIDGMRILLDDYTLSVEYRVKNSWAFILCGLILIIAVACTVVCCTRRARR